MNRPAIQEVRDWRCPECEAVGSGVRPVDTDVFTSASDTVDVKDLLCVECESLLSPPRDGDE